MRVERVATLARSAVVAITACAAVAPCIAVDVDGYVRPAYIGLAAGRRGPLADANRIAPGTVETTRSGPEIDSELRASGHGISAVGWLQAQRQEGDRWRARGHVDEHAQRLCLWLLRGVELRERNVRFNVFVIAVAARDRNECERRH